MRSMPGAMCWVVKPLRDRADHLLRRLRTAGAFQSRVVAGRHVTEGSDLFAAQSARTAALPARQTDVGGLQSLAPKAEEIRPCGAVDVHGIPFFCPPFYRRRCTIQDLPIPR